MTANRNFVQFAHSSLANKDKSKYIVFRIRTNEKFQRTLSLMGAPQKKVSELEYLGVFLTEDLELAKDSHRVLHFFYASFFPRTF